MTAPARGPVLGALVAALLLGPAVGAAAGPAVVGGTVLGNAVAADVTVPVPAPPAPDPAALAALPRTPAALPGLAPVGPCPAAVPPTGFDAFLPSPDTVPGADGSGVLVAVVDSGVAAVPRLAGGVLDGGDLVGGTDARDDCDGHGTAVAGLVAATPAPGDGLVGTAPGATVLAVRADSAWYRSTGGTGAGDEVVLARGIRAAAEHPGVRVITLALAACRPAASLVGGPDAALGALRTAVREAVDRGVVVVAAAGNVGPDCPANDPARAAAGQVTTLPAPGWFDDDVLTVGAVDDDGRPDPDSLAGPWVDVAAPGDAAVALAPRGGLTTALTLPGSGPAPLTGTSVATARVAGLAALLAARFPTMPAREIVARLVASARPAHADGRRDPVTGAGVVDAAAALAGRPGAPPAPAAAPAPAGSGGLGGPPAVTLVVAGVAALGVIAAVAVRRRRAGRSR